MVRGRPHYVDRCQSHMAHPDHSLSPRLLVSRHDGSLTIFTLERPGSAWAVDDTRTTRHVHHSMKAPVLSVVLDARTGMNCRPTPSRLADVMDSTRDRTPLKAAHCFWVIASRREIRVHLNVTGEKVSKVSFSSHDTLDHASLITAHGMMHCGMLPRLP